MLTGTLVKPNGFLGAHATSLTVIPEGDDRHEFLGFIMPRTDQYSANRSYFSWLCGNKEYTLDARIKGGERHMIMSGEYDKVFPMSIFPEYLIKAIIAGDIDRMEALGITKWLPKTSLYVNSLTLPNWNCNASCVRAWTCFARKCAK